MTEENDDRWPEWLIQHQQQEQAEAHQWAERVSKVFQALHLVLDPIDWRGQGRMASIFSSGVEVGALSDLHHLEPKQVLDKVRRRLVEDAAGKQLHTSAGRAYLCTRITPEPGMVSLWRVRLDGYEQGVSIAEYTREGKRVYEYYRGPINT